MTHWLQTLENLKTLITQRNDLRTALEVSIAKAGFKDVHKIDDYYALLTRMLCEIPTQRIMGPSSDKFHYLISQSPENILKRDPSFRQ